VCRIADMRLCMFCMDIVPAVSHCLNTVATLGRATVLTALLFACSPVCEQNNQKYAWIFIELEE